MLVQYYKFCDLYAEVYSNIFNLCIGLSVNELYPYFVTFFDENTDTTLPNKFDNC